MQAANPQRQLSTRVTVGLTIPFARFQTFDLFPQLVVSRTPAITEMDPPMTSRAYRCDASRIVGAPIGEPVDMMDLQVGRIRPLALKRAVVTTVLAFSLTALQRVRDDNGASLKQLLRRGIGVWRFVRCCVRATAQVILSIEQCCNFLIKRLLRRIADRKQVEDDLLAPISSDRRVYFSVPVISPGAFATVLAPAFDEEHHFIPPCQMISDQGVVVVPSPKARFLSAGSLSIEFITTILKECVSVVVTFRISVGDCDYQLQIVIWADALNSVAAKNSLYLHAVIEDLTSFYLCHVAPTHCQLVGASMGNSGCNAVKSAQPTFRTRR